MDKIEFEALIARLDEKDRASVLAALPTIGLVESDNEYIASGGSLLDRNNSEDNPTSSRGKTPGQGSSARPTPAATSGGLISTQGSQINIDRLTDSFSVIPEEDSEVKSSPNSQLHPKPEGLLGTGDGTLVASNRSMKSTGSKLTASNSSLVTPRREKRRASKT